VVAAARSVLALNAGRTSPRAAEGMASLEAGEGRVSRQTLIRATAGYTLMVVGAIAAFLLIRAWGETLVAPPAVGVVGVHGGGAVGGDTLFRVLVALLAVMVTGQILGRVFSHLGQPPVIGEVIAGILLGPSLIGEAASVLILPPSVAPFLGVIAQLGVILYMFIVGLELNGELLRHRAHATVAVSHASIVVPFLLGSLLALLLYPRLSNQAVPFTSFALFMGVAMSITAFPVLARILTDRGMARTSLGVVALSCAATDDVTAWCLLAFVVGVAQAQVGGALLVVGATVAYIALMVLVIGPILRRTVARWDDAPLSRGAAGVMLCALLLSTLTTELIGIHAIFGAFLLGALIPHDSRIAQSFIRQLEHVVTILFLPAFFAFTGMRTRIDLVTGVEQWLICAVIIVVATVGKFGGTFVAARLTGLDARTAAALGTLMNTRGLMELVVLNIGLDLQVISTTVFSMMVLMALVTTVATSPVLRALVPAPVRRPEDPGGTGLEPRGLA
jgi:Kef-type K+ transport system membrane component KefB